MLKVKMVLDEVSLPISEIDYFKKQIAEAQIKQQDYLRIEIEKLISKVAEKES